MPNQRDVAHMCRVVKRLLYCHVYPLYLLFWETGSIVERPYPLNIAKDGGGRRVFDRMADKRG